jgi:hypothetical protein
VLRLRFEVDYLARGGNGDSAGPGDDEAEELDERQAQLEEAQAALEVSGCAWLRMMSAEGSVLSSPAVLASARVLVPVCLLFAACTGC